MSHSTPLLVALTLALVGCSAETAPPTSSPPVDAGGEKTIEPPRATATTLDVTAENASVTWVGTKDEGKHDGGFKVLSGTVVHDADSFAFTLDIDTDSLWSDDEKLTGHLKSPDFFDVRAHPKATFVSTSVDAVEGSPHNVTGDLTLRGVTKSISFPATITSTANGLEVSATFTINRQDFGMTYGTGKVHDDVTITASVKSGK